MLEYLIQYVDMGVEMAKVWGPLLIIVLMAIESSVVPLPSEVIIIPAGVMVARQEFMWSGNVWLSMTLVVACGAFGSLIGSYVNYVVSSWLGRPILHKYGKYFFLSPHHLDRAEDLFREYGDVTIFVCRLLPGIRHLISIPAGISRMALGRFTFFTTTGAGLWCIVLAALGYFLGKAAGVDKSYREIILNAKKMLHDNTVWVVLGSAILVAGYVWVHKKVMKGKSSTAVEQGAEEAVS
ncbi:TPA: DedA family protein [Candidatus Sumerlaeota bacterium]|nr:DedA family protein [Candidatus Sumerlaeota bacterium]